MASSPASLHPPRSEEELKLIERGESRNLSGEKLAAFELFKRAGLPHRRVEGWRWSDVRSALTGVKPSNRTGMSLPVQSPDEPFFVLGRPFVIGGSEITIDHLPFSDIDARRPGGVTSRVHAAEVSPVAALALGLASHPGTLSIDIGKPQPRPLRMVFGAEAANEFHHVSVRVAAGMELEVVETHLANGAFGDVVIEYILEKGARVSRTVLQTGSAGGAYVATAVVRLRQDARYEQTVLATGARLARIETHLTHEDSGSEAVLNGAYLVGEGLHADFTSHVRHAAPHCLTRQTVKGVARKGGKGVFQGKFLVDRAAQKTDAEMEHHALLLEDGAEVNAKPELEIYADDVACAHGNTVGALDQNALFYLRQRGIPLDEAQAMLIQGFVEEAFELASPKVREILMQEAQRWLLQSA
jgi:Fe-S cluster assembly protein SufD